VWFVAAAVQLFLYITHEAPEGHEGEKPKNRSSFTFFVRIVLFVVKNFYH